MRWFRRLFRYSLIHDTEIIAALRANVSDLQRRLNSSRYHMRGMERILMKAKQQQEVDRVYTDRLKEAAVDLVNQFELDDLDPLSIYVERLARRVRGR